MFYSTEILCDKRYALSTVWRAGNTAIGARTTGIRRKAVLEVSVEQTCGTIRDPPGAPIALRLQGTLLYGTARIYQEQCRYVLTDSERTQRAMARLYNGFLDDKLDKNAGKAKSVQIILPNDPCFDLDLFQLPPFDFDAPSDGSFLSQERQASWTNMSMNSRSSNNTQLPQLMLDADSSAGGSYDGGFRYSASGASNMQDSPTPLTRAYNFQDEENILADVGLFIDENGNIIEEEPRTEPQLPDFPARSQKTPADDVVPMTVDVDDQFFNPTIQTTISGNPVDKLPTESGSGSTKASLLTQTPSSPNTVTPSPSTIVSRQAHQRASRTKVNFVDSVTQIPLRDYFNYVTNYAQNMERVTEKRDHARALRRANDAGLHRQIAHSFTFGRGVFGVVDEVKAQDLEHPLAQMFSGSALEDAFFGEALTRAKRRRIEIVEPSTPVARGIRSNLGGFEDEQDIELGRQPASALSDNPSLALNRHSSALPGSSAHGSAQHSVTGIRQLPDGRLSSAGFPDSPSFFERYSDEGMDLPPQLPSDGPNLFLPSASTFGAAAGSENRPNNGQDSNSKIGEEVRTASVFFDLVRKKATEEGLARSGSSKHRWVEFDYVVAPFRKNRSAVVGAFMSLLTLTTSRKLRIQQDEVESDVVGQDIFIGVRTKKRGKGKTKRGFHEISEDNSDSVGHLASDGDLMSGPVFPSPLMVNEPFCKGSELANVELTGTA